VASLRNPLDSPSKEFTVDRLLETGTVSMKNVDCRGTCRHRSAEECAAHTHLVFPYRGVYLRHVGGDQAVADANHVLFFNEAQGYRVSHPVTGGDTSLVVSEPASADGRIDGSWASPVGAAPGAWQIIARGAANGDRERRHADDRDRH